MKTFYTILGSGRVARHLAHYFQLLELPHNTWSRQADPQFTRLADQVRNSSHILLAVSDQAIAPLAERLPKDRQLVHFSGALSIPGVAAAHPLMTFSGPLKERDWYEQIPFVLEEDSSLQKLLPGLSNPYFHIKDSTRAKYHALIAMAGNFSYLLWRAVSRELESSCGLGHQELKPFLQQVLDNFEQDPENLLSGPLARQDWGTVDKHVHALQSAPALRKLYLDFVELFKEEAP